MGLNNSVTAESCGRAIESGFTYDTFKCQVKFTHPMVSTDDVDSQRLVEKLERLRLWLYVGYVDAKSAQLHVQALT